MFADGKSDAFIGRVVKNAMSAEQELDEEKFIKHAARIANQLDRTGRKPMKVVFPVWGSKGILEGNRRWGDVRISFNVSLQNPFLRRAIRERFEQVERLGQGTVLEENDFTDLPLAVCKVQAVNAFDAFELAESAISTELGLYSIMESRVQNRFPDRPTKHPINMLLLAPHMTVHNQSGAIAHDIFWFNSWSRRQRDFNRAQGDVEKIRTNVSALRKKIHKLPWQKKAELALARHYQAFSQMDFEASFLDGWRLLEAIGGERREKSETLVKRAAWFFEDSIEKTQVGLHLMHRRHLISHGRPVRGDDNEGLAFQIREFLTPMFVAVLTNPFNFRRIHDLWEFCDLPLDQSDRRERLLRLKQKLYVIDCGEKFKN